MCAEVQAVLRAASVAPRPFRPAKVPEWSFTCHRNQRDALHNSSLLVDFESRGSLSQPSASALKKSSVV